MQAKLAELVDSKPVVIFTWVKCPYCVKAKELLGRLTEADNIANYPVDTMKDGDEIHNQIIKETKHETVPAIYIRGKFVGGCSDVEDLHKQGKLVDMINGSKASPSKQ
jgi:glutaredoxin 3